MSEFAAELGRALVAVKDSSPLRLPLFDRTVARANAWHASTPTIGDHESRLDGELVRAARHGHQTTEPFEALGCRVLVA